MTPLCLVSSSEKSGIIMPTQNKMKSKNEIRYQGESGCSVKAPPPTGITYKAHVCMKARTLMHSCPAPSDLEPAI